MNQTLQHQDEYQAWVGCLGCYNNGNLHQKLLNADQASNLEETDLVYEGEYLGGSKALFCTKCHSDEFFVADFENVPRPIVDWIGESVSRFVEAVELLEQVSDIDCFLAYLSHTGCDIEDAVDNYRDAYTGYDSLDEWAAAYIDENYKVPEELSYYIDCEKFGRDQFLNGYVFESEGYVFHNR